MPDDPIEALRRSIMRLAFKPRLRRSPTEFRRIRTHKPWEEPIAEWIRSFTTPSRRVSAHL